MLWVDWCWSNLHKHLNTITQIYCSYPTQELSCLRDWNLERVQELKGSKGS